MKNEEVLRSKSDDISGRNDGRHPSHCGSVATVPLALIGSLSKNDERRCVNPPSSRTNCSWCPSHIGSEATGQALIGNRLHKDELMGIKLPLTWTHSSWRPSHIGGATTVTHVALIGSLLHNEELRYVNLADHSPDPPQRLPEPRHPHQNQSDLSYHVTEESKNTSRHRGRQQSRLLWCEKTCHPHRLARLEVKIQRSTHTRVGHESRPMVKGQMFDGGG